MSKINTLLAKAMSTSSEDEAISCLRMARKHGSAIEVATDDSNKSSASVERLQKHISKLTADNITLQRMYVSELEAKMAVQTRLQRIGKQLKIEQKKPRLTKTAMVVLLIVGYVAHVIISAL